MRNLLLLIGGGVFVLVYALNFRKGPRFIWVILTAAIRVIRSRMTRNKNMGAFIESMIIRI